jgi:flagellar motor switch protein FliG
MENKPEGQMEIFVGEREKVGYNFINEQDIVSILTLLKDEPPLHLAIICYHLKPDLAAGLLSRLDANLRKQVVEHLSSPQVLMRDDVKSLGETLKQNVRGLLYGVDQFFAIYDTAAPGAQGDMIKTLETQTPMLVEKIKNEMFTFDDLMAVDTNMLRIVFREVPLRTLAVALMGSPVPMRDRVLGVLPQGAAEIIRQEIDMNPVRSQKIIDEERRKVIQVVRRLVWDKKIVMPPRKASLRAAGTAVSVKG